VVIWGNKATIYSTQQWNTLDTGLWVFILCSSGLYQYNMHVPKLVAYSFLDSPPPLLLSWLECGKFFHISGIMRIYPTSENFPVVKLSHRLKFSRSLLTLLCEIHNNCCVGASYNHSNTNTLPTSNYLGLTAAMLLHNIGVNK